MFQLTAEEWAAVESQLALDKEVKVLKSQIVISSFRHGGRRRSRPYAFTEQGVAMLSSVLRSERAVKVNVEIMRTFVKLRRMLASNAELARRLEELERKYDAQFRVVFDAIRAMMEPPPEPKRKPIGFLSETESRRKARATGPALARR